MSYNQNFYNNQRSNFTFHDYGPRHFVPPPPPPPMFFMPPSSRTTTYNTFDQDFIKRFEQTIPEGSPCKKKSLSITEIRDEVKEIVTNLNEIKKREKELSENINTFSNEEWQVMFDEINHKKELITKCLSNINDSHLDMLRKLLAKRTAKRLRLKRLKSKRKREKEDRIKKLEERSRKIDENLQKIKDEINKAKQAKEAKIQADIVLKEVLRKKHDAKKCIIKLDALKKLRKARLNTAKGRGEQVSENETQAFDSKIDNLKSLWAQKLIIYEKEEEELQIKLKDDSSKDSEINDTEKEVASNLAKWKEVLFGDENLIPQVDFNGDLGSFFAVRWQWDQFLDSEGTPLPVGWVIPTKSV